MIKIVLSDFSRTILYPRDEQYSGSMNSLHEQLCKKEDYDVWEHFAFHEILLSFYKNISVKIPVYVLTTKYLQAWPPVKARLDECIRDVFIAEELDLSKSDPVIYCHVAETLGIQTDEILFLDDAEKNIAAAAEAGCVTIRFEEEKQAVEDLKKYLNREFV